MRSRRLEACSRTNGNARRVNPPRLPLLPRRFASPRIQEGSSIVNVQAESPAARRPRAPLCSVEGGAVPSPGLAADSAQPSGQCCLPGATDSHDCAYPTRDTKPRRCFPGSLRLKRAADAPNSRSDCLSHQRRRLFITHFLPRADGASTDRRARPRCAPVSLASLSGILTCRQRSPSIDHIIEGHIGLVTFIDPLTLLPVTLPSKSAILTAVEAAVRSSPSV